MADFRLVWGDSTELSSAALTFLGALLGGGISYLGIRTQLKHDLAQRATDRLHTMKRPVYLEAAEGVAAGLSLLGEAIDLSTPQAELLAQLRSSQVAMARANVVADKATLTLINDFSTELTKTSTGMFMLRQKALIIREELINLNKREPVDAGAVADSQKDLDETIARMLWLAQDQTAPLQRLLLEVLIAIRKELGLCTDRNAYSANVEDLASFNKKIVDDFIRKLRGDPPT